MLYRWHNGMKPSSNAPLVWYHTFLPLDAALKATPGIGFLVFEGERFYVLPETGSRARPVHHDFGEVPERPIVHTNLTTMMVMWADAFASGAVTLKAPTDTAFQTDDATLRRLHGKHDATATFPYAAP